MGIGQALTLRCPSEKLCDINTRVQGEAWCGYRSEYCVAYEVWALYKMDAGQITLTASPDHTPG